MEISMVNIHSSSYVSRIFYFVFYFITLEIFYLVEIAEKIAI